MQVAAKWIPENRERVTRRRETHDRQTCGSSYLCQCRRGETNRPRSCGGKARRLRKHSSGDCAIDLPVEREERIVTGTLAADQDFAQTSEEVAGGRGANAFV